MQIFEQTRPVNNRASRRASKARDNMLARYIALVIIGGTIGGAAGVGAWLWLFWYVF